MKGGTRTSTKNAPVQRRTAKTLRSTAKTSLGHTPAIVAGVKGQDFFERVWSLVSLIPRGRVTTYGHIARALGAASSARMVGWAMNSSHGKEWVPAHRVLNRNGELSGKMHFATPTLMRELLEAEDVQFDGDCVRMDLHLWIPPMSPDV